MKQPLASGLILLALCVGLPAAATGLPAAPRRPQRPVAPYEAGVAACLAWAVADTAVDERGQRIYDLVLRLESGELLMRTEADIEKCGVLHGRPTGQGAQRARAGKVRRVSG